MRPSCRRLSPEPKRVLLTPVGSAGDNLPFIGLGRELARRGHAVTVAATDHFAELVRRSGLRFVTTGTEDEYRAATADPDLFHPTKGLPAVMERVGEYNRRLFDVVTEHAAGSDSIVVAHTLDFASRAIGDATGLPVVRAHLQPTILRSVHDVPVLRGTSDYSSLPRWLKRAMWWIADRAVLDPVAAPIVDEMRARVGLARVRRVFATQIDSPLLTLGMFPEWYAPAQRDWPASFRACSFPLFDGRGATDDAPDVAAFLAAGSPPVVVTPGSAMRHAHEFFAAALGACGALGKRALLLTQHVEQVPSPLPDGARRFDYVPLSAILPRCAAIVHHGGIGTTAAALAAGVPQIVVPFSHDQPDNAARIVRLGVGARIMPRRLDRRRLAAALEALLSSPDVRRQCDEAARRCAAADGIASACDLIESVMLGEASAV